MTWQSLESQTTLKSLLEKPASSSFAIFKHSTTCLVSAAAKKKLEKEWKSENPDISIYYLDLLAYRELSNTVADHLEVVHQSPQLIVVKNGEVVYHASHLSINSSKAAKALQS